MCSIISIPSADYLSLPLYWTPTRQQLLLQSPLSVSPALFFLHLYHHLWGKHFFFLSTPSVFQSLRRYAPEIQATIINSLPSTQCTLSLSADKDLCSFKRSSATKIWPPRNTSKAFRIAPIHFQNKNNKVSHTT